MFPFPLENFRASRVVVWLGARRWTRKRQDDRIALYVSEGTFTLNDTMGFGQRVTVLKDDTVMPRKAVFAGEYGSVEVTIATGWGTRRINFRIWVRISSPPV